MAVFGVALAATARGGRGRAPRRRADPAAVVLAAAGCSPGRAWPRLGLGLLVIGPSTFLPTYGQEVLGLGAVAAGAVLATMSLGWPLASSQSARFFLRIGFRDTAADRRRDLPRGGQRLPVRSGPPRRCGSRSPSTFVLGFGLGLLSVCTVVGPQSTVTWNQRGVVTGTVMFCRYLGQSLGAAIFGAIFNAVLSGLHAAPARCAAGCRAR